MTDTETLVCEDIKRRQQIGINKYGTTVANNNRELLYWLQHHYEELLDAAVYVKRQIQHVEREEHLNNLHKITMKWAEEAMDCNGDNG